jgi:SPP1 gp7 family putative phage head morphogenesis protein
MAARKKGFNVNLRGKTESAEDYARRRAANLVTAATATAKKAIRSIVVRSIEGQFSPIAAARLIRDVIGLDPRRAQAVANYRESLGDRADVADLTSKYANELLAERAEAIARTETMEALNEGQLEAWRDAQEEGLLSEDATKTWLATEDERLCPICEYLDGQTVALDEDFVGEDGELYDAPTAHVNCRCSMTVRS